MFSLFARRYAVSEIGNAKRGKRQACWNIRQRGLTQLTSLQPVLTCDERIFVWNQIMDAHACLPCVPSRIRDIAAKRNCIFILIDDRNHFQKIAILQQSRPSVSIKGYLNYAAKSPFVYTLQPNLLARGYIRQSRGKLQHIAKSCIVCRFQFVDGRCVNASCHSDLWADWRNVNYIARQ